MPPPQKKTKKKKHKHITQPASCVTTKAKWRILNSKLKSNPIASQARYVTKWKGFRSFRFLFVLMKKAALSPHCPKPTSVFNTPRSLRGCTITGCHATATSGSYCDSPDGCVKVSRYCIRTSSYGCAFA